ncbi:hypothetical protein D2962_14020 [Biomaibacter acetigenes]|uniref:Uncharacterized protein n=1 Tax=Biomaibacter acetigenes TaxID=2316383 RepID=A0A3G2R801_9FIRM|nr:hypothetical protein D2962_14020 [Biomaibacter acetigenes]RKL62104.1 hypothetical protein DXT63_13310 [Thermoanaerobacteraceae bacterium SP2]
MHILVYAGKNIEVSPCQKNSQITAFKTLRYLVKIHEIYINIQINREKQHFFWEKTDKRN